jgi:hypothetical protein
MKDYNSTDKTIEIKINIDNKIIDPFLLQKRIKIPDSIGIII